MLRFASDRVYRVSSLWFAGAVFLCSATLHVCQTMYRPKQFYAWHATSVTEFHPSQTGADRGVVLPVPGCIRFVQTAACFGPNFWYCRLMFIEQVFRYFATSHISLILTRITQLWCVCRLWSERSGEDVGEEVYNQVDCPRWKFSHRNLVPTRQRTFRCPCT